jgi:hypothetical protein
MAKIESGLQKALVAERKKRQKAEKTLQKYMEQYAEFVFITGPLEGCLADDQGLWREFHNVETFEDADADMQERFKNSQYSDWDEWIHSWEVEDRR